MIASRPNPAAALVMSLLLAPRSTLGRRAPKADRFGETARRPSPA
jgi:hypothetical protein